MSTRDSFKQQSLKGDIFGILVGQAAKGTTWAMIICLAGISLYISHGRAYLDLILAPFYHNLIVLTLAIVTVFTLGCVLHMIFIGDKSARELRRELRRQNDAMAKFIADAQIVVCELQTSALRHAGLIRPRSLESIAQVRRILHACQARVDDVKSLLSTGDKIDLIDAHELLGQRLVVIENAVSSLIGANPVPPIDPGEIVLLIESMIQEIETDLRRAETRRQAA